MKKIICLLCLLSITTFSKAKCGIGRAIYNYNQNFNINISANPWTSHTVVINYGDSLLFWVHASGCQPPNWCDLDSVSWSYNGNFIGSIQNNLCQVNIVFHDTGLYVARYLLDGMGPYYQTIIQVNYNPILSASQINNINSLNIFPTTVTSSITIQLNSIKTNDIEISFFDMNGRLLKNYFYKNVFGEFIKNENTEALAKGIYFLRIKTGEEVVEKKFVKL